jgi:hypothetical protein
VEIEREGTGAHFEELALEEAVDLSYGRLRSDNGNDYVSKSISAFFVSQVFHSTRIFR